MQTVDVHLPTTDGHSLVLPRHTRPNKELEFVLHQPGMTPAATTRAADLRLTACEPPLRQPPCSADLWGIDHRNSMD